MAIERASEELNDFSPFIQLLIHDTTMQMFTGSEGVFVFNAIVRDHLALTSLTYRDPISYANAQCLLASDRIRDVATSVSRNFRRFFIGGSTYAEKKKKKKKKKKNLHISDIIICPTFGNAMVRKSHESAQINMCMRIAWCRLCDDSSQYGLRSHMLLPHNNRSGMYPWLGQ